ncbi:class I ribonucleotide reductase maintenance protein YfaE [Rappaport israeli]|uniref:class I ribonucleotide reductase maintenance protein YfaE n=1 Tax=Rappaport israeli TaxID=1839807 RepID=UPI0009319CA2
MPFVIRTNEQVFELKENENLLDALLRTGHKIDYQCRNGYCGSCRIALIEGKVCYPSPPLAALSKGQILPCCAIVKTNIVLNTEIIEFLRYG